MICPQTLARNERNEVLKTLIKGCKIGSGVWERDWKSLLDRELSCGSSSAVERLLAKEEVVGSNPIFRSRKVKPALASGLAQ